MLLEPTLRQLGNDDACPGVAVRDCRYLCGTGGRSDLRRSAPARWQAAEQTTVGVFHSCIFRLRIQRLLFAIALTVGPVPLRV
jgi:hypothetical protein